MMFRLLVAIAILLVSCAYSSTGYIQVYVDKQDVLEKMSQVQHMLEEDDRFVRSDFSANPEQWIKEATFTFDPTPNDKTKAIEYSIYLKANINTGGFAMSLYEFSTPEMSRQGKAIFHGLVKKVSLIFNKKEIIPVFDKDKIRELSEAFEKEQ